MTPCNFLVKTVLFTFVLRLRSCAQWLLGSCNCYRAFWLSLPANHAITFWLADSFTAQLSCRSISEHFNSSFYGWREYRSFFTSKTMLGKYPTPFSSSFSPFNLPSSAAARTPLGHPTPQTQPSPITLSQQAASSPSPDPWIRRKKSV